MRILCGKRRLILLSPCLVFSLAVALWPVAAMADTRINVRGKITPAYPAVGQTVTLEVRVSDNKASPIDGAKVVALFMMDPKENLGMLPMEGAPDSMDEAVRVLALPGDQPGKYLITTSLDMKGRWRAQVWVSGASGSGKTTLDLAVLESSPSSDLNWPAVAVVGLLVAGIVSIGMLLIRKRPTHADLFTEPADLLHHSILDRFVRSRFYPAVFQWPTLAVFAVILYALLAGPASAHDNLGIALTWILWWPALPLVFFVLGRFWCAICPMSALSDLGQRFVGRRAPPPAFLRKWGIWFIFLAFVMVTWLDLVVGLTEVPRYSAYLLLVVAGGAVLSGILFQRRAWCRHLCFIGGLCGNYAMASVLELRARQERCESCRTYDCVRGSAKSPGCPMYEFPRTMASNRGCNLCGNCVKNCPKGAVRISFRAPTKEIARRTTGRLEEALLAAMLLAIVLVQTLVMLDTWSVMYDWLRENLGIVGEKTAYSLVYFAALAAAVSVVTFFSFVSGVFARERSLENLLRFSYALIPLGLASHAAHNLNHLFGEGLALVETTARLFGRTVTMNLALLNVPTIQVLQYSVVASGVVASLYAARRIAVLPVAKRASLVALPYSVLILAVGLATIWMFSQQMAPRMRMSTDMHNVTSAQIESAKAAVRAFEGRNLPLEFVHLEEHGYRDIILRSGTEIYFVDSRNNMVVSMFSSEPRFSSTTMPLPKNIVHSIANGFARKHYPGFERRHLESVEVDDRESPFPGGYIFVWQEFVDGVPTPNYVRIMTDGNGRIAIYSAREIDVTVPSTPRIDQATALALARSQLGFTPFTESAKLDIGPEITGVQLLRWTIIVDGPPADNSQMGRPQRAEVIVDALSGEVMSVVRWS